MCRILRMICAIICSVCVGAHLGAFRATGLQMCCVYVHNTLALLYDEVSN